MGLFPYKERGRTLAQSPWRHLTAGLHKGLSGRWIWLLTEVCVWWEAERQWAQAERREAQTECIEELFPNEKSETVAQAAQRGWMFYTFDIFNYQNRQAQNNLVWTHIWPCLSRRLDQRPPDVSYRLNYLVVLWFCDVSLHMQILEKIWNLSSTLKLS